MTVTIRIEESTREKLNNLASQLNMTHSVIIDYLIDKAIRYEMFQDGWEKALAQSEYQSLLDEDDRELRKRLEIEKAKRILSVKQKAFEKYLDVLEPVERRQFLEAILGSMKDGDFLDKLSNYQLFVVDGAKKLCEPDEMGRPKLIGINPELIIVCDKGYHVVGGWCQCSLWRSCPMRGPEYEKYLALHGTPTQQRKYIESQSRVTR
jgi:predicted transcriptional regulator